MINFGGDNVKEHKKIISVILAFIMLFSFSDLTFLNTLKVNGYAEPNVFPPANTHPRVLFTEDDIPDIKLGFSTDQNKYAYNRMQNYSLQILRDGLTGDSNGKCNTTLLAKIESVAFNYAMYGDGQYEAGTKAVTCLLKFLETCGIGTASSFGLSTVNQSRTAGYVIYVASEVYDWCYDKFTPEQRNTVISYCEALTQHMEMNYPATNMSSINSHAAEAQLLRDLLTFAIATYDERPDIWKNIGGRFYEQFVPFRALTAAAHYNLEGDSYGQYRHAWDSWAYLLITGMGAPEPYSGDDLSKVGYSSIYMRRPDGQWMRDGDTAADTTNDMWNYWADFHQIYMLDSGISGDPFIKQEYARRIKDYASFYENSPIILLATNKGEKLATQPLSFKNLPLSKYFKYPAGISVARTGWSDGVDSPDVVAEMKIGGLYVVNHQHLDSGHFQIYYKGILASDSGVYQGSQNNDNDPGGTAYNSRHHLQYACKSVAHNTMLVLDPNECTVNSSRRIYIRDGGQMVPNEGVADSNLALLENENVTSTVEAQEIDPNTPNAPDYTYIKGNLTNAYSAKVSDYKRSFMFFNMKNSEVPGVLVVFDKITSSNADFQKKWLLHGIEKPTVNGSQTIFRRTYSDATANEAYNGKMTVDTLAPTVPNINVVGGSNSDGTDSIIYDRGANTKFAGYKYDSETDEGSTWRIEVSSKSSAETDNFLNVIQVSDNDKNHYLTPTKIETTSTYGVQIGDRVATFSKSGTKLSASVTFATSGTGTLKYTLCDMIKGTWKVVSAAGTQYVVASGEGGVLSFEAPCGAIAASYYSSSSSGEKVYNPTTGNKRYYSTKIGKKFIYNKAEPMMVNDTFVMPVSTIIKYFNLKSSTMGKLTKLTDGNTTAILTEGNSNIVCTGPIQKTIPTNAPVSVDADTGEIMVPAESVINLFGGTLSFNDLSSTAFITLTNGTSPSFSVNYSIDGKNYRPIPNFDENVYEYNVQLPENVYKVKLNPVGDGEISAVEASTVIRTGTDYNPKVNRALIGDFHTQSTSTAFSTEWKLAAFTANNEVTIVNEEGICDFYYTPKVLASAKKYTINYYSKQPRLTEFITDPNNVSALGGSTYSAAFLSGGAAFNDNRTLIDTSEVSVAGENYAGRTWALANLSTELVSASMFVMPLTQMASNSSSCGNVDQNMFYFKADTPGKVVVLTTKAAGSNTSYYKNTDGWSEAAGSGGMPAGITTTLTSGISPRNKNDYSSPKYYTTAIPWKSNNNRGAQIYNTYRLVDPGITGTISSTHVDSNLYMLNYAYVKEFEAGERVYVKNPGTLSYTTSGVSGNSGNAFSVFVIWDEESRYEVDVVTSVYDDRFVLKATIGSINTPANTYDIYAAIYKSNKLVAIKKNIYQDGENLFAFDYLPDGDETIKIITLNHNLFAPLFNKVNEYDIFGEVKE